VARLGLAEVKSLMRTCPVRVPSPCGLRQLCGFPATHRTVAAPAVGAKRKAGAASAGGPELSVAERYAGQPWASLAREGRLEKMTVDSLKVGCCGVQDRTRVHAWAAMPDVLAVKKKTGASWRGRDHAGTMLGRDLCSTSVQGIL
jgi:hypothetical protein